MVTFLQITKGLVDAKSIWIQICGAAGPIVEHQKHLSHVSSALEA